MKLGIHILLFIAMGVVLGCSAWAQDDMNLELLPKASIAGRYVLLKDVAKLSGVDDQTMKMAGQIKLTTAPRTGYTERLSRREISRLVRQSGLRDVVIDGAQAVSIETESSAFDMDVIAASAKTALSNKLSNDSDIVQISLAENLPQIYLPQGDVRLRNKKMSDLRPTSRMTVWVDVMVDGEFYQAIPVRFEVKAMRPVLVTQNGMRKGQSPSCANLNVENRDVAALNGTAVSPDCALIKGRLIRDKSAGDALIESELEAVPAITEGDVVRLAVVDGSVALELHAVALIDGKVGQHIPVRASIASEPVDAMVVGPGEVKVTER
jgi:flagella basal body P-ring formation protein FlgA